VESGETLSSLEQFISTCITLRKVRSLKIEQPETIFSMRPQSHVMLVSPFGTMKSSLLSKLREIQGKQMEIVTNFTKAAVTGTISKQQEYVPSILFDLGGKTVGIDEWNTVSDDGQESLLSLLENQELTRGLGFKMRDIWKKSNRYASVLVKDNKISAKVHFSCIACAMAYPIPHGKVEKQKSKAILSRFLPIFVDQG